MHLLKGMVIAFSMYSAIPMPKAEWKEEDMRWTICFFPFVGAVIGLLCLAFLYLCRAAGIGPAARCLLLAAIPILVSGGIHMDGYMDTMDARHAHCGFERRLEILKDSHIGAFAVIMTILYELLYLAGLSEIADGKAAYLFAIGFFLSRCMSGLALVSVKNARGEGLAYTFASGARVRTVRIVLLCLTTAACIGAVFIFPAGGAVMALTCACGYLLFRRRALRDFGGITGDLLGCFLLLLELAFAWIAAAVSLI